MSSSSMFSDRGELLPIGCDTPISPVGRLRRLLKVEGADLRAVIVFAIAVGLLSLVTPLAVQVLINSVVFTSLLQPIVVLAVVVLLCLAFATVLRVLQILTVERLQRRIFVRAALSVSYRLPRVRAEALRGKHAPELVNRFFDVITVQKAAASLLLDAISAALQTGVGLLLLSFYHPVLLAFDVFLLITLALIFIGMSRGITKTALVESKKKYKIVAWLEIVAERLNMFRNPSADKWRDDQTAKGVRDYLEARQSHFRLVLRQRVAILLLQIISLSALLGLGGWLVVERQLSVGQLVAAELIVTSLLSALVKLSDKIETYYDLLAGLDKLGQLADLPEERPDGLPLDARSTAATVTFSDVCSPREDGRGLVTGVNLHAVPGECVAVLGRSGSGKSLLADVVFGMMEPAKGRVMIDGREVRHLARHTLRQSVTLVRDPEMLPTTVQENITIGFKDASYFEVERALRTVGVHDGVTALPNGLETLLTPTGSPLSREDTLRLTLARVVLERPRLLVIDGAMDSLETESALELLKSLRTALGSTILLLTARASIAEAADAVHTLEAGGAT